MSQPRGCEAGLFPWLRNTTRSCSSPVLSEWRAVIPCNHLDKYTPKEETFPSTRLQLGTCQLHWMCLGSVCGRGSERLILLILSIAITIINCLPCLASVLSFADWRALAYSPMYRGPSATNFVCCLPSECFQLCSVGIQGHNYIQ